MTISTRHDRHRVISGRETDRDGTRRDVDYEMLIEERIAAVKLRLAMNPDNPALHAELQSLRSQLAKEQGYRGMT